MDAKAFYRMLRAIYLVHFSESQARRMAYNEATAALPF
jgi:hypothetical protein